MRGQDCAVFCELNLDGASSYQSPGGPTEQRREGGANVVEASMDAHPFFSVSYSNI